MSERTGRKGDGAPADGTGRLNVLSLFSGCGGMDIGFEGGFLANAKCFGKDDPWVEAAVGDDLVRLRPTRFATVFANDIIPAARRAWTGYMRGRGHDDGVYHLESIVDLVKAHRAGFEIFPADVDLVTGGFPCQDFSVAGKRKGFNSKVNHRGDKEAGAEISEENRGMLYYWMKQVIDIVRPKMFVAENVKGLMELGDVKDIIQRDFESADGNGYHVFTPQVLHAGNYGVPESRERVFFIGLRKDALLKEAAEALSAGEPPERYSPYPKPSHNATAKDDRLLPKVTAYDALKHLPEPEDEAADASQRAYSKCQYLSNGSQGQIEVKLDDLAPTIRSEHHGNIEFRRLSPEHGGKHFAELERGLRERRLTVRECATIQTFPPDYRFVDPKKEGRGYVVSPSDAYKIIGNAVPPVLAFRLACRIQEVWSRYFGQ